MSVIDHQIWRDPWCGRITLILIASSVFCAPPSTSTPTPSPSLILSHASEHTRTQTHTHKHTHMQREAPPLREVMIRGSAGARGGCEPRPCLSQGSTLYCLRLTSCQSARAGKHTKGQQGGQLLARRWQRLPQSRQVAP